MTLWQQPSNRLEFLEKNLKPIVSGARVLDFCCGTGMNGLYALEHGAKHVTFTDVRPETFTDWIDTHAMTQGYNVDYIKSNNYVWKFFDANELQKSQQLIDLQNFDIIIYHGHFYHARNHFDIVKMFSNSSAKHIIFETKAVNNEDLMMKWHLEPIDSKWATWSDGQQSQMPTGQPGWGVCRMLFEYHGWKTSAIKRQTWKYSGLPADASDPNMIQARAHFSR